MRYTFPVLLAFLFFACQRMPLPTDGSPVTYVGSIERTSPQLDELIAPGTRMQQLADGFTWSEGPVWVPAARMLLFSDVPENKIYKWTDKGGLVEWLEPSGYTGTGEYSKEPGSNGLLVDQNGDLLLAQHGDRRIARLGLKEKILTRSFTTIADTWEGRKFNSPNDLIQARDGSIYFTDPPYGLPGQADSELREIPFQGVYLIDKNGKISSVIDNLSRPNGVALSPDERTLYVAVSDPKEAVIYAYDRAADGTVSTRRVFFDGTDLVKEEKGLPDGMVVDKRGNVYATGPGGVYVFSPEGKQLGLLRTERATANVTIGNNGKRLYITADDVLLALPLVNL